MKILYFFVSLADLTMTVTCDNKMNVYVDGSLVKKHDDWTKASTINLGTDPVLVAIQCTDLGVIGGILAHFSNGEGTDSTWKCRNGHEDNWNQPGFDDSHWPNAHEIIQYPGGIWKTVKGMSGNPYWIWTNNYQGHQSDRDVFCRKNIIGK